MNQAVFANSGLMVSADRVAVLKTEALNLPSVDLDWRQTGELEMLLNGAYAPLCGYMVRADYESVLENLCLQDGTMWPVPKTLKLSEKQAASIEPGKRLALRDSEGFLLAVLTVTEKWLSDPVRDRQLLEKSGYASGVEPEENVWHLAGTLEGVCLPVHHDFQHLRLTPFQLRTKNAQRGWKNVVGWLAQQPMHRAQFEFCQQATQSEQAGLLLLPFCGGDLAEQAGYFSLMRTYQNVLPRFPESRTQLAMLPIQSAGPGAREKLMRMILARHYGCTHLILGDKEEVQTPQDQNENLIKQEKLLKEAASKLGIAILAFPRMKYVTARDAYLPEAEIPEGVKSFELTDEEFRRRMQAGQEIPSWYGFPEVIAEMHRAYPPRARLGFTVFFTGLSGAGKSTLARALASRLMELGNRPVSLLDGDIVRRHLSSELGFSREHRDINVRRIGFVASEITKNRGVAICAPIAPYRQTRRDVRAMIEAVGGFIEVHVSTPLETCESRDRKGLYAKARAGLIPEFTGVSDPYEVPEYAEVILDTSALTVDEAVGRILLKLEQEGYLK